MNLRKWNPLGANWAQYSLALLKVPKCYPKLYTRIIQDVPSVWLQLLPYLITIIVLVGVHW